MTAASNRHRILIVEDNAGDARLVREALREGLQDGPDVIWVRNLADAIQHLSALIPDAVLVDLDLPDSDGLHTLREVCRHAPRSAVIVMTGLDDEAVAMQTLREGAQDYLLKGELDHRGLRRAVRYARERKEAEVALQDVSEQLLQSQRMEAIGRLAGGIAHDFNNLLTVIDGYARLLLETTPEDDPAHHDLAAIHTAAERAAQLTQQLLAYSRKQVMQPRVISLGEVVSAMCPMLQRTLGEDIALNVVCDDTGSRIEADPSQIEQVVMNLAVNARDAMPRGGELTIKCTDVILDTAAVRKHPEVSTGSYAQMTVTDTGCGMDPTVVTLIFDPFFTTKPFGQGTGLGLSTVYGIVKQSRGHVLVDSTLGKGTTITVLLPLTTRAVDAAAGSPTGKLPPGGNETLFLVEDERDLLSMLEEFLCRLGYTVHTARTGHDALTVFKPNADAIDLVVSDIVLPDMTGPELCEGLRSMRADLHVLFMSAYPGDTIAKRGLASPDSPFLSKPFTPAALGHSIRKLLDDDASRPRRRAAEPNAP
jgi:two-component system cell cycle sensor histidine kinase/response regulator CckA